MKKWDPIRRANLRLWLWSLLTCVCASVPIGAQQLIASTPEPGQIHGTVTDETGDVLSGATVVLNEPAPGSSRQIASGDDGSFNFDTVAAGGPYRILVTAHGFTTWTSAAITVHPNQVIYLPASELAFSASVTTVTVHPNEEQLATEQVRIEEQQRVLGIIPNFYVVYDHHPTPLTAKLKFQLALRVDTDPITFLGAAVIGAVDQAGDTPAYVQGARGYGERVGANYLNGLTDIMFGGAILPSLLHQDPRYFYQGTGTRGSRIRHAVLNPIICRGDNGKREPNYSSLGGYLASGAIANAYYPESDRGAGLLFGQFAINIAADMSKAILDEFVLRHFTPSAKNQ